VLLLVTILLVLVAAVTLLIGIFSDELWLIFVSIGASALAAIVLAVLSQVSRRKGRAATTATAPEPLPARQDTAVATDTDTADATATAAAASIAEVGEPVTTPARAADAPTQVVETTEAVPSAGALPIADYDALRVNEILPRLESLDLDELETVAVYEEGHKNRSTVLNTIDKRMDELEAAGDVAVGTGAADDTDDQIAEEAAASIEEIGEPVVALDEPAPADGFPIPDYDDLSAEELIPRLQDLDADQLEIVADREEAGKNRDVVLDAIDDRLDVLEGIVPAPAAAAESTIGVAPVEAVPARPVTAKKASAKKVSAKKASAKKAAAKKAAAVPVKKAAAAKKAAASTKRTLEPAKKAPAARKTAAKAATAGTKAAKKAAPAKKATAAKKASKR
jgi:hypothetical protein